MHAKPLTPRTLSILFSFGWIVINAFDIQIVWRLICHAVYIVPIDGLSAVGPVDGNSARHLAK
jgi:hypothetical protein